MTFAEAIRIAGSLQVGDPEWKYLVVEVVEKGDDCVIEILNEKGEFVAYW